MENDRSIGGFEELQHVPSNLEGHEHVQECVHAQERPEEALISHRCKSRGSEGEDTPY